jgi:hypothetical protein
LGLATCAQIRGPTFPVKGNHLTLHHLHQDQITDRRRREPQQAIKPQSAGAVAAMTAGVAETVETVEATTVATPASTEGGGIERRSD